MTTRQQFFTAAFVAFMTAGTLVAAGSNVASASSGPGRGEPTLAEVRQATERFRDVNVALAEGYIRDPFDMCETAAMM